MKVLASPLNLGGTYAEELCLRAGVAKDAPVASLTDADLDALFTALNNLAVAVEQERRPAAAVPVSAKMPSLWWAAFIDAGQAADNWHDLKLARGYGLGLRWRSPVGPLRVDVAYGEQVRHTRLHFSVGIAF